MRIRLLMVGVALAALARAQSLKDCRSVYLRPMPEALDEFVGVELLKWGAVKVVASEEKADCVAAFGRRTSKAELRSSGTSLVPSDARVSSESVRDSLPEDGFFLGARKSAALTMFHGESGVAVWADSKSDGWSLTGGVRALARKLVEQMKKDYARQAPAGR